MKRTPHVASDPELEDRRLREATADTKTLLTEAARTLRAILDDACVMEATPLEAQTGMEAVLEAMDQALGKLKLASRPQKRPAPASLPGGPTRRQGQFLAYIREYIMRNEAGVAPTHADLQWYFQLTPPSVNSMLIRLEQRGFIRRIPHQARAIELIIDPDWIPPLERPFKARR